MEVFGFLIAICLCACLFILCRSLVLWYWRVNDLFSETYDIKQYLHNQNQTNREILKTLQSIDTKLENIMYKVGTPDEAQAKTLTPHVEVE